MPVLFPVCVTADPGFQTLTLFVRFLFFPLYPGRQAFTLFVWFLFFLLYPGRQAFTLFIISGLFASVLRLFF